MARALTSRKRAKSFALSLFLVGVAALIFWGAWWPGILLVVGIPLALKQYLSGRMYDTCLTLVIFGVGFITVQFDISWQILLPVLFVIGALYIFLREIYEVQNEAETEDDRNHELEEDQK
jgi:hypothetical protein